LSLSMPSRIDPLSFGRGFLMRDLYENGRKEAFYWLP